MPQKRRHIALVRRVKGHSMMPMLPPETLVYATGWFRRIEPGDVVIFWHEGREKIKRVELVKDARAFVTGDNVSASSDSREIGWIEISALLAKVCWPRTARHRANYVKEV